MYGRDIGGRDTEPMGAMKERGEERSDTLGHREREGEWGSQDETEHCSVRLQLIGLGLSDEEGCIHIRREGSQTKKELPPEGGESATFQEEVCRSFFTEETDIRTRGAKGAVREGSQTTIEERGLERGDAEEQLTPD